ncbi:MULTISPECIES: hypothetical protein [Roseomonadaceae]|uniref:Tripartite tricarboxylate transporter TctB family protein n=1 Tax=Falsiroseomonas oleicola TaxID=2801474 RepID=A0ABS6HHU3_9PROT|nr:hypothetical protein [Roseomonas oleicola]MBU8546835.1 hypothetical protein [Roseomonas oleicola]
MQTAILRRRIAWAPLALVTALAGIALAYLLEARGVSHDPQNLLLLQPTAWLVLGLWVFLAFGFLRMPVTEGEVRETPAEVLRILAMVGAFGLFILGLEAVGYDLSIWGFTLVALVIGGERKPLPLLLFPPLFMLGVVHGFRLLVPYPFPTSLL